MKKLTISSNRLSKKEQRHIQGGALRECKVFCSEGPIIRCYYNVSCKGNAFSCCVTCDGRTICA
jgi:hypothetical protein